MDINWPSKRSGLLRKLQVKVIDLPLKISFRYDITHTDKKCIKTPTLNIGLKRQCEKPINIVKHYTTVYLKMIFQPRIIYCVNTKYNRLFLS